MLIAALVDRSNPSTYEPSLLVIAQGGSSGPRSSEYVFGQSKISRYVSELPVMSQVITPAKRHPTLFF